MINPDDAMPSNTYVLVPTEPQSAGAAIWVIDNGEGMDADGFRQLWKIAQSNKRGPKSDAGPRPPSGKLATYVLGQHLTNISKCSGTICAVTMNFEDIEPDQTPTQGEPTLSLRTLTENKAQTALSSLLAGSGPGQGAIKLFAEDAEKSWTVATLG